MNDITANVNAIVSAMPLEKKVGQLFILAFPGKDPAVIQPLIQKYQIGGCYISQDNASTFNEARTLTKALQTTAHAHTHPLPLLLGVDQEGSWGVLIPEAAIGPGNLALGAADDLMSTAMLYGIFAQEMNSVGYQAILGPCADINLNPNNPIIGTRSFGENAHTVAMHVAAAVKSIKTHGGIATAKHFPGHGDTHADTHREIPIVDKPISQLRSNELLPFQAAIDAGVDMIMTSHILFPQIDNEYPATLSQKILTDLLRDTMGFKGIIITDSMNMGAIRKHFSLAQSTMLALQAGADFIMLSEEHYDHSDAYLEKQIISIESIIKAVQQGEIAESLVDERVSRIIQFKLETLTSHDVPPPIHNKQEIVDNAAQAAITLVKHESNILPLKHDTSVAVVNTTPRTAYERLINSRGIGPNQQIPAFDTFQEEFSTLWSNARFFSYESIHTTMKSLVDTDIIIAVTEDYPLPGEDFDKTAQISLVKALIHQFPDILIILGLRSPYELAAFPNAKCYMSAYSSRNCSATAAAHLLSDYEASLTWVQQQTITKDR